MNTFNRFSSKTRKSFLNSIKKILEIEYNLDKIFLCNREEYLYKIINYENNQNEQIKDLTDMKSKLNKILGGVLDSSGEFNSSILQKIDLQQTNIPAKKYNYDPNSNPNSLLLTLLRNQLLSDSDSVNKLNNFTVFCPVDQQGEKNDKFFCYENDIIYLSSNSFTRFMRNLPIPIKNLMVARAQEFEVVNPFAYYGTTVDIANSDFYDVSTNFSVSQGFGVYTPDEVVYQTSNNSIDGATFSATVLSFDTTTNTLKLLNTVGTANNNQILYGQTTQTARVVLQQQTPEFIKDIIKKITGVFTDKSGGFLGFFKQDSIFGKLSKYDSTLSPYRYLADVYVAESKI